jgi:hypothetical protein
MVKIVLRRSIQTYPSRQTALAVDSYFTANWMRGKEA